MNKPKLKKGDTFILTEKMIEAKKKSVWRNTNFLKAGTNVKVGSIDEYSYTINYKDKGGYIFMFNTIDDNLNAINPLLYNLKR